MGNVPELVIKRNENIISLKSVLIKVMSDISGAGIYPLCYKKKQENFK